MSSTQAETKKKVATAGHAGQIGLFSGPIIAGFMLLIGPPDGLSQEGWIVAAMAVLMAIYWTTEAIPIAVTSLLPLIILPLSGARGMADAAAPYADKIIFLLLGGFILAKALEHSNLHKRIAWFVLNRTSGSPAGLIGGFMIACALLSMWISNTATALMLVGIGVGILAALDKNNGAGARIAPALFLGIAYSASVGGMMTPVGTPTNLLALGYVEQLLGRDVSFVMWMGFAVPAGLIMLIAIWRLLVFMHLRDLSAKDIGSEDIGAQMSVPTPMQRRIFIIFLCVVTAWILRPYLQKLPGLSGLGDAQIALSGAAAMFILPSGGRKGERLLTWEAAVQLPWGIVLLFGGGLALASAISESGLAAYMGTYLAALTSLHPLLVLMCVAAIVAGLTEVSSNTATLAALLPVIGAFAPDDAAITLMVTLAATLAASCAFMMPVATPPNAIVMASGRLSIIDMVRTGIWLNILGIVVIAFASWLIAPQLFT
ncbi:DASS family sodium-coupled anion symporter [Parasphingorhabdus litoris]|uniref:DASS family sodium-coupled anion symporter n=1 Tax=Parasphingorhabdus litoris TaxID=394733 RepID=A0ABN1ATL0_9SPHN|nr:DASS family sodium-coupled anion symporter [Parasphingorhabdus litoris]